jgi:hypothetical protein
MVVHQLGSNLCNNTSVSSYLSFINIFFYEYRVDYDDDDVPSSFSTLNPTTPSYSHLTDALASGLGGSHSTNSSSLSTSTSGISSNVNSLLNSTGGPTMCSSASVYSPYSNHPTPSPGMQMDYQRKKKKSYLK